MQLVYQVAYLHARHESRFHYPSHYVSTRQISTRILDNARYTESFDRTRPSLAY